MKGAAELPSQEDSGSVRTASASREQLGCGATDPVAFPALPWGTKKYVLSEPRVLIYNVGVRRLPPGGHDKGDVTDTV